MKRALALFGGIALLASVVVVKTGGADPSAPTVTFRVVERATTDAVTNKGVKTGDSLGDVLTFANAVYNPSNTKRVGSDNGYCVRTEVGKAFECVWTTSLPGGLITVEGPFLDVGDSTFAITGGTGKYSRASGWMDLHARDDMATEYDFVFHVQG